MLNRFIRIQFRYIGSIADGCLHDGLFGIHFAERLHPLVTRSCTVRVCSSGVRLTRTGRLMQWLKDLTQLRPWMPAVGNCQLYQR